MGCCDKRPQCTLSLNYPDPNCFDSSQWCRNGRVSTCYTVYRVLMASVMLAIVIANMVLTESGWKWFIFMTNQGIAFLALHYLLDAALVVSRWKWESGNSGLDYHRQAGLPAMYKVLWFSGTCFFDAALFISAIYWSLLHSFAVKQGLFNTPLTLTLTILLHGFNSVSCLIDTLINRRPMRILHMLFPICFGIYYMVFSLIYWAAGGLGVCQPGGAADPPKPSVVVVTGDDGVQYACPKYIYPILDWESRAGLAVAMIGIGVVALTLVHLVWMGVLRLRQSLYDHTMGRPRMAEVVDSDDAEESSSSPLLAPLGTIHTLYTYRPPARV